MSDGDDKVSVLYKKTSVNVPLITSYIDGRMCVLYDSGWQFLELKPPPRADPVFNGIHINWERYGLGAGIAPSSYLNQICKSIYIGGVIDFPFKKSEWYNIKDYNSGDTWPVLTERENVRLIAEPYYQGLRSFHKYTYYYELGEWNLNQIMAFTYPYGPKAVATPIRNPDHWEVEAYSVVRNKEFSAFHLAGYFLGNGWLEDEEDYPNYKTHEFQEFDRIYRGNPILKKPTNYTGVFLIPYFGFPDNFVFRDDPNIQDTQNRKEALHETHEDWGSPFKGIFIKYRRRTA